MHLQSSAKLIFSFSHNCLIISEDVMTHLHQYSSIINLTVDKTIWLRHTLSKYKKTATYFQAARLLYYLITSSIFPNLHACSVCSKRVLILIKTFVFKYHSFNFIIFYKKFIISTGFLCIQNPLDVIFYT